MTGVAVHMGANNLTDLRRGLRDLVALTSLPEIWTGDQPQQIAESLSGVLLKILHLDLVYLYFTGHGENGQRGVVEVARTPQQVLRGEHAHKIGLSFTGCLDVNHANHILPVEHPLDKTPLYIAVAPIGHGGREGYVVAGTLLPDSLTDLDHLLLRVAANQAVTTLQQLRLLGDLRIANEDKDKLLQRMKFLAEASSTLASSLNHETTLARISELAVPVLADWCSIVLLEANASIRVINTVSDSAPTLEVIEAIQKRNPFDLNGPTGTAAVLRTGQSLLVPHMEMSSISKYAVDAEHLELLHKLNTQSAMVVGLLVRGEVIGAICLNMTHSGRHYDADDLLLAEELAHRAGIAIDQARLYEAERQAREHAEQANATKSKFLAMISHELRTPLTSIKGFATSLLTEDVTFAPEDQREFIKIICDEADKLTELIEQLLVLTRMQAGSFAIQPEPTSVHEVVGLTMAQLNTLCAVHELVLNIPQRLPAVQADKVRVGQVITNLVHNAAKFAPPDSVIRLAASRAGDFIQIDISDQGPGIPTEQRELIFEAFRQIDGQPNKGSGAGLGLAIAKGIIEAHGGRIWVQDSTPGATISFTLPIPNP